MRPMPVLPVAALCLALLLLGCGEQQDAPSPPPRTPQAAAPPETPPETPPVTPPVTPPAPPKPALADGAEIFRLRCATCHGENGDGHGPASAGLTPQPRDFRDRAWQDSVSDAGIESVIALGGPAVSLSPLMPAHPDLAAQPGQLAAVRAFIRSLRR